MIKSFHGKANKIQQPVDKVTTARWTMHYYSAVNIEVKLKDSN